MNPIKSLAQYVLRPELTAIHNSIRGAFGQSMVKEATIADLQRDLQRYELLTGTAQDTFNRDDIRRIVERSRATCLGNPLAQRFLSLMTLYTFAQGVSISTEETAQAALEGITGHRQNSRELFGPVGWEYGNRELCATGNLFVMRIPKAAPVPQVRVLPVEQFQDIVCDPEDAENRWFYLRRYSYRDPLGNAPEERKAWHPDGGLDEAATRELRLRFRDEFKGSPIVWDKPVSHYALGGYGHWKWGIPPTYAALNWLTAHTKFISEWTTVVSALSRFANQITGAGATTEQLAAAQAMFQSSWVSSVDNDETNPPHVTGSTWISNDQWKLQAFQARGMTVDPQDGRQIALMVFSAFDLPAHFFGDVDQGNLATATSMDRPTELLFRHHQERWKGILQAEAEWALGVQRGRGVVGTAAKPFQVRVNFPPILNHNPQELMGALVDGLTLKGSSLSPLFAGAGKELAREILSTLDIDADTITAVLDSVYDADGNLKNPPPPPVQPVPFPEPQQQAQESRRAALVRSVQALTAAVQKREAISSIIRKAG